MEYLLKIKKPQDCSENELIAFYELAIKAEQVNKAGLKDRIRNCLLIGFCYYEDLLIGISAIKVPIKTYKYKIFTKAGIKKEASLFNFELGYSFTEEKFRGRQISYNLNKRLVNELPSNGIYATTANPGMKRILKNIGFTENGKPYKGEHNLDDIQILGIK